jgi:hypothetical protein
LTGICGDIKPDDRQDALMNCRNRLRAGVGPAADVHNRG